MSSDSVFNIDHWFWVGFEYNRHIFWASITAHSLDVGNGRWFRAISEYADKLNEKGEKDAA